MASFGETLKRERESRNISLREIAETTKINIRHLEALEADRFAALPGGVFNKGFVRAYADYLGIDAAAAVRDFLEATSNAGVESDAGTLNHAASDPGGRETAAHPRISMGPDPHAAERGREWPIAGETTTPAAGLRRVMTIAFWVVVGGALLAGTIFMRHDRRESPPADSAAIEPLGVPEASAEQEAFEPPEGMFVDAGPAVPEGADEASAAVEHPPAETEAGPPPQEPQPDAGSQPRPSATKPAAAPAGSGKTPGSVPPPPARPKPAASSAPKRTNRPKPAEPQSPKASPPSIASGAAPEPAPPPPGPMMLEVEVTRETWLWLACDSDTRIDRRVRPGESTAMQCLRSIRVSAHDAGAIRLRVNGAECMPLGDDGARVYGYTIRFDDAHLICRSRPSR